MESRVQALARFSHWVSLKKDLCFGIFRINIKDSLRELRIGIAIKTTNEIENVWD